jgi:hypothetical protein
MCENPAQVINVNNYFFCTNNYNSIKMGMKDRRYFILEVSDIHQQDTAYFAELREGFDDMFKAHLLGYLLNMDIREFNPYTPPMTDLKRELQDSQKSFPVQFIEEFDWVGKELTNEQLWQKYSDWIDDMGFDRKYMGKPGISFGRAIAKHVDVQVTTRGGKSVRVYRPKEAPPQYVEPPRQVPPEKTPMPPPEFETPEDDIYTEEAEAPPEKPEAPPVPRKRRGEGISFKSKEEEPKKDFKKICETNRAKNGIVAKSPK